MDSVVSRQNAPHYTWGDRCDGFRLLDGDALSVVEERMPPGTSEVRHRHVKAAQFFYVLEGALTIEIEGQEHAVGAEQGVAVAPGQAHTVVNTASDDAVFLVISSPSTRGDRVPA
jgi:quercetin dioxygenase-like cupin family protein